jgi:hypothetical protein
MKLKSSHYLDLRCKNVPKENGTMPYDVAIDTAHHVSKSCKCDVDLYYQDTKKLHSTICNY